MLVLAHFIGGKGLPFFSGLAGEPDAGVTQALTVLGFAFVEKASEESGAAPFAELEGILESSPVMIGPLDMSFLSYNPNRPTFPGVDHYVLIYKLEGEQVFLHDPAGFGNVFISKTELADAWRAEAIEYKRGHYRYWTQPRRTSDPTPEEIATESISFFRALYGRADQRAPERGSLINGAAILSLADLVRGNALTPSQAGHLRHFALPLGVKRALDFATFFETRCERLSGLKREQAALFGKCETHLVLGDFLRASEQLSLLAALEGAIRTEIEGLI